MLIKKYKSEIIKIYYQLPGIITIEFKSLGGGYKYFPGQFLHLTADVNYDGIGQWPESRCFSIQSNPDEDTIKITYSVKGNFTRHLEQNLKVGFEVWLKLPYGNLFTQIHNKVNTVFIAGGTGITPFLSLFTHKSFTEYTNPKIYIGFRSEVYNIYKTDLDRSCNSSRLVKTFYEDTDGQLDIEQILLENDKICDFFISGPPAMIKSFKSYLKTSGLPEDQIKTDDWA
jgi:ferredoxin-NADP reductase